VNIVVVVRQVPDLIEPLEVDDSGAALDWETASFLVNECDDHALEQGLLLKEAGGGTVTVVAVDGGDVDNTLYTAAAKGADAVIKIPRDEDAPLPAPAAATLFAEAIRPLAADLVLVGVQAHNELEGVLGPMLAGVLGRPYVGVIRGVKAGSETGTVAVWKEFPGAVMARLTVRLPAVLGILGADQPPRYVPVSRIRAAMKETAFQEPEIAAPAWQSLVAIRRLSPPAPASRAQMLEGSEDEIAARIAEILAEKGLVK
jgi:electron transfer flavoprotein beta subunit